MLQKQSIKEANKASAECLLCPSVMLLNIQQTDFAQHSRFISKRDPTTTKPQCPASAQFDHREYSNANGHLSIRKLCEPPQHRVLLPGWAQFGTLQLAPLSIGFSRKSLMREQRDKINFLHKIWLSKTSENSCFCSVISKDSPAETLWHQELAPKSPTRRCWWTCMGGNKISSWRQQIRESEDKSADVITVRVSVSMIRLIRSWRPTDRWCSDVIR